MCQACESNAPQAGISPALAEHARRIEATLPGPAVSDQSWSILLGRQGGAVPWAETQRMLICLERAASRPGGCLRCDAA